MAYDLELWKGDYGISFAVDLILPDGSDVVFDSGDVATLRWKQVGIPSASFTDFTMVKTIGGARCSYTFVEGDTDTPGRYDGWIVVDFSPTYQLTWPHATFSPFSFLIKDLV